MEAEYVLAREILKLANRIISRRNADTRSLGLTAAQADSLVYLARRSGKTVSDLKDYLGVTHQTARGIAARMAEKGLITLSVSREDGRYKTISVTDEGRALFRKMEQNGTHLGDRLLRGMGTAERAQFLTLLSRALDNLDAL